MITTGAALFFEMGPAALLALPETRLVGAIIVTLVGVQVGLARAGGRPLLSSFVPFLGVWLVMLFCLRAAILVHVRGGVTWRGVLYPLDELRKGARLELF